MKLRIADAEQFWGGGTSPRDRNDAKFAERDGDKKVALVIWRLFLDLCAILYQLSFNLALFCATRPKTSLKFIFSLQFSKK